MVFGKIQSENLDFDFVKGKEEPSFVKVFDVTNKEVTIDARIRDIDDDVMFISPLVIPTCDGHFVAKVILNQKVKNRFLVAMRCANVTAKMLIEDIKKFLNLKNYNECQFNLHNNDCSNCDGCKEMADKLTEMWNYVEGDIEDDD